MSKKKIQFKLYLPVWGSTLLILVFVFLLLWILIVQFYTNNKIKELKEELEKTTSELAGYAGDDVRDFLSYLDYLSVVYANDVKSIIVKPDNKIVDFKTKFPIPLMVSTTELLKLEPSQIYLALIDNTYYCFAKTNFSDGHNQIFLMNSCLETKIDNGRQGIQNILLIVMSSALFLSVFITFILSRLITNPITNLAKNASSLGDIEKKFKYKKSAILEMNQLQDALIQTKRSLEEKNKLEKEFISSVTHELKSPLTVIRSYAEMLKDFSWKTEEKRERDINIILQQVDVLTKDVNDLMLLSKIQANAYATNERLDLSSILAEMIEDYQTSFAEKGIQVELRITPDLFLNANFLCIKYCFTNFLTNAIKYCRSYIEIRLEQQENYIRYVVMDNGQGIKEENVPLVWNRFYRENPEDNQDGSTGMGLAIVKTICDHCGYTYSCQSKEGEGSRFEIKMYHSE